MLGRQRNVSGGGAKTNTNGLFFEEVHSLEKAIDAREEFTLININPSKGKIWSSEVYNTTDGNLLGIVTQKHGYYTDIVEPQGVNWEDIFSSKLLPDNAFINYAKQTIYLVEMKYQESGGSVDEKMQTGPFKLHQYQRLTSHFRDKYDVQLIYFLNQYFLASKYDDVKEYLKSQDIKVITDNGSQTFPLNAIGL